MIVQNVQLPIGTYVSSIANDHIVVDANFKVNSFEF